MNICKDCKYFVEFYDSPGGCNHGCPPPTQNLVSGELKYKWKFFECSTLRSKISGLFGGCGPKGKFFEPNDSECSS